MARVDVGSPAPEFTLDSVNMGRVSLRDYSGKRVVLIFGRYFGCPVCQLDFDELLEDAERIMMHAEIIYFTQSSSESSVGYIQKYMLGFPVVPVSKESGYKVYRDYGVGNMGIGTTIEVLRKAGVARRGGKVHGAYEGRETQSPADFVVEDGKIVWAHRSVLDVGKLLGFLEAL